MSIDFAFKGPIARDRSTVSGPVREPHRARGTGEHDRHGAAPPVAAVAVVTVAAAVASILGRSSSTGTELLVRWIETQLVLGAAVAVVLHLHGRHGRGAQATGPRGIDLDDPSGADRRVAVAEEALGREQERLHELRATVTGIALTHRLLHGGETTLPRDTQERLARMYDSEIGRLERLLAPGRDAGEVEVVDLHDVIDPLVTGLEVRGHPVHWAGTSARVVARFDDVSEMVHVLLENAVAHGGGRAIGVDVLDAGGSVRIRVRDGGPGVPATLAGRIFDRGTRGEHSRGHGLGLHIAHRLATDAGGGLTLDPSRPGAGATFVIALTSDERTNPCHALSA